MSRCRTTQVSVNSQIRVIKNLSFSLLLVTFCINANFEEYLWKYIYLRFPGSLKPSSSISYVLFSSEEKYCGALLLFHKIPLKLNQLHQPLLYSKLFISNYVYHQYFLQALTPALTFTLKPPVIIIIIIIIIVQ